LPDVHLCPCPPTTSLDEHRDRETALSKTGAFSVFERYCGSSRAISLSPNTRTPSRLTEQSGQLAATFFCWPTNIVTARKSARARLSPSLFPLSPQKASGRERTWSPSKAARTPFRIYHKDDIHSPQKRRSSPSHKILFIPLTFYKNSGTI
jgi:hypothetical protein